MCFRPLILSAPATPADDPRSGKQQQFKLLPVRPRPGNFFPSIPLLPDRVSTAL